MKTFSTTPKTTEELTLINCPLCGSTVHKSHWDLNSFSLKKCPCCSLVYQNPQPLTEDITQRYDDNYLEYELKNEKGFLNLMLLGLKDIGFNADYTPSGKILDIGCATGLFLSYMKERGWETAGVEVCSGAASYGNRNRGVNIFCGTLENSPFESNSFDIIHLSHVIEHINDPDSFVGNIYSLLKPGGVVYCTTPNISGFQARLFKDKWRSVIPDHLVLFSVGTLKKIFIKNSFSVVKYKTWGGLCAGSGYPAVIKKIMDRLSKVFGFGDVVIIKAVKPL